MKGFHVGSHGTQKTAKRIAAALVGSLQDIFASAFVGPDVVHLSGDVQMQVMPVVGYKERSP